MSSQRYPLPELKDEAVRQVRERGNCKSEAPTTINVMKAAASVIGGLMGHGVGWEALWSPPTCWPYNNFAILVFLRMEKGWAGWLPQRLASYTHFERMSVSNLQLKLIKIGVVIVHNTRRRRVLMSGGDRALALLLTIRSAR